jgi:SAM-dependent methyltransferase
MPANPLYDDPRLAAAYARNSAASLCNARYERPALRRVTGPGTALDVLDAGCAAGEHARWFARNGARVTALDASPAMAGLARENLAGAGRVLVHDLRAPLPFAAAAFDLVVSSLTLHYVEDWAPVLAEFRRVLRPAGRLVVSTHHPFTTLAAGPYFALHEIAETWPSIGGEPVTVRFFHRPLAAVVAAFVAAGFRLAALHEPRLEDEPRPDDGELAGRLRNEPWFLIVEALPAETTAPANP